VHLLVEFTILEKAVRQFDITWVSLVCLT